jgi:lysyl-tRNA synthetase class 2
MEDKKKVEQSSQVGDASREYAVRIAKVEAMRAVGIDPWPACKEVTSSCRQALESFNEDEAQAVEHALAGRIMALRLHGKTAFMHIQDMSGKIQVYVRQDVVGDRAFEQFMKFIDLGDIIWVKGTLFRTKTGEVTLRVTTYTLLSKCLHPLPEKFHGLADIETIYRQRYLDLIMNPESFNRFQKRSHIIRLMRDYFDEHGFLEVETPMLHQIPGGAAAKPFITHHNALGMDLYLRIAPELYLKRLVVGGFERVYEINRNFRNEGISTRHNPEFTMVEFYVAHHDYIFMMDFIEQLLRFITGYVNTTSVLSYGSMTIDMSHAFERISMYDAVVKYAGISAKDLEQDTITETAKAYAIPVDSGASWGHKLAGLFEELVEKKLVNPTFVTDYPIEVSPLTKRDPYNGKVVPRFELFIGGMEIANGYNELNDPFDQASRFREQAVARSGGDDEAHYYDADYITALEYGLPPTVGAGIGIDRLTMLLTDTTSIKDVILFPALKKRS